MRKITLGLMIFLVSLSFSARAAEKNLMEKDGDDWLRWGDVTKDSFAEGFLSANSYLTANAVDPLTYPFSDNYDQKKAAVTKMEFQDSFDSKSEPAVTRKPFTTEEVLLLLNDQKAKENSLVLKFDLRSITKEQLIRGLDNIYLVYENRHIKLTDAVYLVKKRLQGTPRSDMDKILLYLKSNREKPDYLMVYDERGNFERHINFP